MLPKSTLQLSFGLYYTVCLGLLLHGVSLPLQFLSLPPTVYRLSSVFHEAGGSSSIATAENN
eukprot:scaffold3060_cov223-Alexandrium_tamarense.AAC.3